MEFVGARFELVPGNKKASALRRDKSPEWLAPNSSEHFSPSGNVFRFLGLEITPEAFSVMGEAFYEARNITAKKCVKE